MDVHTAPTSHVPSTARAAADELVRAGYVTGNDRDSVARTLAPFLAGDLGSSPGPRPVGRLAAEVAGYLGGVLVIAAGAVFLASRWSDMDGLARVLALLVSAAVLGLAGLGVHRSASRADPRVAAAEPRATEVRRLLTSCLFVAAAMLAGSAAGLWAAVTTGLPEPRPSTIGFAVAGLLMTLGYRFVPSAVAHAGMSVTAAVAGGTLVFDVFPSAAETLLTTVFLVGLAGVWIGLTESGILRELTVGRLAASFLAVLGAHADLGWERPWVTYLLLALIGITGLVLYARTQAWTYLALGVVAATLSVTEAAVDWSNGALGAAGALLVAGTALLLVSVLGLRLRTGPSASGA